MCFICLSRHTELKVVVPESGVIGLYANSINIDNIFVNGQPVRFTYNPPSMHSEIGEKLSSTTCVDAAEAACLVYFSLLEREMAPDLLVFCYKSTSLESGMQNPVDRENVGLTECRPDDANQNAEQEVKILHLTVSYCCYWYLLAK